MTFEFEESDKDEVKWYRGLASTKDSEGSVTKLRQMQKSGLQTTNQVTAVSKVAKPSRKTEKNKTSSKVMVIEEVKDDDDEEDDLVPYPKPDSDPEDDTEDATMVDRNKPKAPV